MVCLFVKINLENESMIASMQKAAAVKYTNFIAYMKTSGLDDIKLVTL
jgi:hypothetical protein